MKIIQSFNTFGGDRLTAGWKTRRAMLAYLAGAYAAHKQTGIPYTMYTDKEGAEVIAPIVDSADIVIVDFPIIRNDTILYSGKYFAQSLQTEAYIHIDIDATLFSLPEPADVYCEKKRFANLGRESFYFDIDCMGIRDIPCSGLLGFTDIAFKDAYIAAIYAKIAGLPESVEMTYEMCWNLEEVLLQRMILDQSKTLAVCTDSHHNYFK